MIRATLMAIGISAAVISCANAASVSFYQLPPNAYPHDVAPAPDGAVWYSGQRLGVLGRFDPKSGKSEHILLGRGSAPHGVIVGPDGAPWLTDSGLNAIVRVDPKTRTIKAFPLPKKFANANLNTAVFDKRGILWFTGQSGVYGRLNPATGTVEAWYAPKGYGPYGIAVTPAGEVWYCSLASDFIARVDLVTGASTVVDPPTRGAGPRRVWSDSKGLLWVSFWNSGGIGRYDTVDKSWKVYPMPVSKTGTYAVYVDEKDRVWATDWQANAIQRFDPKTEKFDTFPSDKSRANVRQLLGRPGETWGGESGTDRLVVVRD